MTDSKGTNGPKRVVLNDGFKATTTSLEKGFRANAVTPKGTVQNGHTATTGQLGSPPTTGSAVSQGKKD